MSLKTTVGQLLINDALPEDLRDYKRVLDGKGVKSLMTELAQRYPDQYRDIVYKLTRLGAKAAQEEGGMSVGVEHLQKPSEVRQLQDQIKRRLNAIYSRDDLTDKQKGELIIRTVGEYDAKQQSVVMDAARRANNPLFRQINSGSRGKPMNLVSLLGSDLLYTDHRGNVIPIPVLRSYSEGLSPAEYWAGSYGARSGIVATKFSTADSGFLSKQLNAAVHRLVVADQDDYEKADDTLPRGYVASVDDGDNEGALLALPVGGYAKNTPLTPKILRHLKQQKIKKLLVRSPLVGGSPEGGVYAKDVGIRETGKLPGIGEFVGLQAAQALTEPLSQGMLCLVGGTEVRMADGSVKVIEEIKLGDKVLGSDRSGNTFPVVVVNTYVNGVKECWETTFNSAGNELALRSSLDHKLLLKRAKGEGRRTWSRLEITPAGDVCLNDEAVYVDGEGDKAVIRFAQFGVARLLGNLPTYDIEVDSSDHLFVLSNGLIVSNSSKHSGGVAGKEKSVGGFTLINSLVQVPQKMPGGATHSNHDGTIEKIEDAPAGGKLIYINGEGHYVPQDYAIKVKVGQEVEAGDVLTDGIPSPAVIVKHKGIGEGRRHFVDAFKSAMEDAGIKTHRRNIELLSRGLLNHVRLAKEYGPHVEDDVIPYSTLEHTYQPREDAADLDPRKAVGKYLERPVLNYTIGTKIRKSMLQNFQDFGIAKIPVHDEPPFFEPAMVRGLYQMQNDPDWMTQMYGSGLKKSLLDAATRGASSELRGSSFVPSLAASTDFGLNQSRMIKIPEPGTIPEIPEPPKQEDISLSKVAELVQKIAAGLPGLSGPSGNAPMGGSATNLSTPKLPKTNGIGKAFAGLGRYGDVAELSLGVGAAVLGDNDTFGNNNYTPRNLTGGSMNPYVYENSPPSESKQKPLGLARGSGSYIGNFRSPVEVLSNGNALFDSNNPQAWSNDFGTPTRRLGFPGAVDHVMDTVQTQAVNYVDQARQNVGIDAASIGHQPAVELPATLASGVTPIAMLSKLLGKNAPLVFAADPLTGMAQNSLDFYGAMPQAAGGTGLGNVGWDMDRWEAELEQDLGANTLAGRAAQFYNSTKHNPLRSLAGAVRNTPGMVQDVFEAQRRSDATAEMQRELAQKHRARAVSDSVSARNLGLASPDTAFNDGGIASQADLQAYAGYQQMMLDKARGYHFDQTTGPLKAGPLGAAEPLYKQVSDGMFDRELQKVRSDIERKNKKNLEFATLQPNQRDVAPDLSLMGVYRELANRRQDLKKQTSREGLEPLNNIVQQIRESQGEEAASQFYRERVQPKIDAAARVSPFEQAINKSMDQVSKDRQTAAWTRNQANAARLPADKRLKPRAVTPEMLAEDKAKWEAAERLRKATAGSSRATAQHLYGLSDKKDPKLEAALTSVEKRLLAENEGRQWWGSGSSGASS